MTPAPRDMPVVVVEHVGRAWRINAPGRVPLVGFSKRAVTRLIAKELPGSAIKFVER